MLDALCFNKDEYLPYLLVSSLIFINFNFLLLSTLQSFRTPRDLSTLQTTKLHP